MDRYIEVLPGVSYAALAAAGDGLKKVGMKEGTNRVGWYLQQYLKLGVVGPIVTS